MPRSQIIGRVEKLEQRQPSLRYGGVDRFIWRGAEDKAALAEAEHAAETGVRLLIVRKIVSPRASSLVSLASVWPINNLTKSVTYPK